MTEQHTIHLPVIRYRDKAGNPTCAADFQTGDVCKFYRTQRLGIGETCVFAETHSAIALDLLQERQYDAVVSLISTTTAVTRISTPKLAPQALALRTPPPPEKLIDALQDRIHQDLGTVRIAKSVRVKRDG